MTDRVLTPALTTELARLRAERDLLRAEVRAWRDYDAMLTRGPTNMSARPNAEIAAARAAVDAFDKP